MQNADGDPGGRPSPGPSPEKTRGKLSKARDRLGSEHRFGGEELSDNEVYSGKLVITLKALPKKAGHRGTLWADGLVFGQKVLAVGLTAQNYSSSNSIPYRIASGIQNSRLSTTILPSGSVLSVRQRTLTTPGVSVRAATGSATAPANISCFQSSGCSMMTTSLTIRMATFAKNKSGGTSVLPLYIRAIK